MAVAGDLRKAFLQMRIKKAQYDEQLHAILTKHNISWTFNLSRAPWWGGQFERLVGVVKSAFHKTIRNGLLTWPELCDVVLDVEITVNNRPLCYVEDDIQLPVLTPSSMLFQGPNLLPEQEPHHLQDTDLRKREKYLRRCKEAMWSRWTKEYLRALRERHNMKHPDTKPQLAVGYVVMIKSPFEKSRNKWPLGIVQTLIEGRDGEIRAVKFRAGKDYLE